MAFGVASRRGIHTGARRRIFAESALVRLEVITISRHEQENTYRYVKKQQLERCFAARREGKCTQMESTPLSNISTRLESHCVAIYLAGGYLI